MTRFTEKVPAITSSYNTFTPILELANDNELKEAVEKLVPSFQRKQYCKKKDF